MDLFLKELEASLLGCPKGSLRPETRFREQPWWDSLALLVFMASFQVVYGTQVTPAQLSKCQTIQDVADLAR
jgi:acyl carrier protein